MDYHETHKSSQIAKIGHDPKTNRLEVHFQCGSVYSYAGVDASKFERFKKAKPHGTFMFQEIKGKHEFTKH